MFVNTNFSFSAKNICIPPRKIYEEKLTQKDIFKFMKAPWNHQTLSDWNVILRTRKIKIFNIFIHLIFKLQCQQLIMSVVFTPKFQLRICLRNSKVTFLERSAPGDFNELSLSFFRLSKVNQDANHSYKYWFLNIKIDKNVTKYDQNLDFSIF